MAQLPSTMVVEPFGEVNVFDQPDGSTRVRATILMKPSVEGAQTGLAIDGSGSMRQAFGAGGAVSSIFASSFPNVVEIVARSLASFLANFDSDGQTTVLYWACGIGGADIEEQGEMTSEQARSQSFSPPMAYGTGTRLLPAVKYFTDTRFPDAPWSIFIFITDGAIDDLEEVKAHSLQLAQQIASGQRQFCKLVLIGVGSQVDVGQMEELDDLDYGGLMTQSGDPIDLWDHKLSSEMQQLDEIFAEVVSAKVVVAPSAEITDDTGKLVTPIGLTSYSDGLPALLEFVVAPGSKAFHLSLPGAQRISQSIV